MSWSNAVTDLRTKLNDRSNDKLRVMKRCIGEVNGTNVNFKTFEFRRVTTFVAPTYPEGVFVNGAAVSVATEDVLTGAFSLALAPARNSLVEATYFIQWFLDVELQEFLTMSCNWLGFGDQYANIPEGLRPAAISYCAGEAYQKLALKYAEQFSETYQLQGAPAENTRSPVDYYIKLSKIFFDEADQRRDDNYKRQGQALSPNRSYSRGLVAKVSPNR